jgi:hypothetical protein
MISNMRRLGPETDDSNLAIDFIENIADRRGGAAANLEANTWLASTTTDGAYGRSWSALSDPLRRTWFWRAWVLQEVALAKEIEVYCGMRKIPWLSFTETYELFVPYESLARAVFKAFRIQPPARAVAAIFFQTVARKGLWHQRPLPLLFALDRARSALATDDRDKTFAILGLVNQKDKDLVQPDYNVPTRDLYLLFAKTFIETTENLQIITLACRRSSMDLPSWVPNWTQVSERSSLSTKISYGKDSTVEFYSHKFS